MLLMMLLECALYHCKIRFLLVVVHLAQIFWCDECCDILGLCELVMGVETLIIQYCFTVVI